MKTTTTKANASKEESALARHSRDTGISQSELRRLCTRAGMELLDKGKLTIKRKPSEPEPYRFPVREAEKAIEEYAAKLGIPSSKIYAMCLCEGVTRLEIFDASPEGMRARNAPTDNVLPFHR